MVRKGQSEVPEPASALRGCGAAQEEARRA